MPRLYRIWSATPLFLSYALSNFKQREQRAVSIAIVNGIGNVASVYGSYIWPSKSAPRYKVGFGCTTGFVLFGGCMVMVNRFLVGDLSKTSAADDGDSLFQSPWVSCLLRPCLVSS